MIGLLGHVFPSIVVLGVLPGMDDLPSAISSSMVVAVQASFWAALAFGVLRLRQALSASRG
jgi:hypothetical protein